MFKFNQPPPPDSPAIRVLIVFGVLRAAVVVCAITGVAVYAFLESLTYWEGVLRAIEIERAPPGT